MSGRANRLPNRLTDLADKLDMPQPTLLRYLKTLCAQGYAYHDDVTGCYALTWKICRLADSVKIQSFAAQHCLAVFEPRGQRHERRNAPRH